LSVNGWLWAALFFAACAVIVAVWLAWAMKHVPYIRSRHGDSYAQLDKLLRDDQRARSRRPQ
jgi:predicted MFS family arabinose efflux permease